MRPKRLIQWSSALVLPVAGILVFGGIASAHAGSLTGVAVCDPTTHAYTVTWTISTSSVPVGDSAVVSVDPADPAPTLVGLPLTVVGNSSATFTDTNIPGNATSAGVLIDLNWTGVDTFFARVGGTVALAGTCVASTIPTPVITGPTQTTIPTATTPPTDAPVTPLATPASVAASVPTSGPQLAVTGVPVVAELCVAFGLILAGTLILVLTRRRGLHAR